MEKLNYYLIRTLICIFKILPFSLLYILSDLLRYILQYLIRYRRNVILDNLLNCFPEKSPIEIDEILKDSYRNLADIVLEGIKGLSMREQELSERYAFRNKQLVLNFLNQNQSVIAVNAHYSNWEWAVLGYGYQFPNKSIGIYKTIENQYLNQYINVLRGNSSIQLFSTRETRFVAEEIPKGKILLLMADQNPSNIKDAIWVQFFNRDTACLHCVEKYALQYHLPIIFASISRIKRGYYEIAFEMLVESPTTLPIGTITQLYMARCEQNIREKPGNWLWSHRRWKHKRTHLN